MITPEQKQLLEQLPNTQYGKALFAYLEQEYSVIGDIMSAENIEELKGRQHAVRFLKKLFYFMEPRKLDTKIKNTYT